MSSCNLLRSHIVDSRFYGHGYSTDEARRVFCDLRRLQRWLDVEKALVMTQAELGLIPMSAARELAAAADIRALDIEGIRHNIERTGHSLIPLLTAWQERVSPAAGQYIHYGATTQDIQDTAQSLEVKDIMTIVGRDLREIGNLLSGLAQRYRDTVMVGRTHGQHALPFTLGLKIAVWIDELLRHPERLDNCCDRIVVSQLFGGVGTMAALGEKGLEILARFSERLGLSTPLIAWHSARDRITEFLSCLALVSGSLAKIANEICQLARDEIGEMEEPFHMGKIGSTTMPHKRNPELCEQVVVLAKLVRSHAGLGFDSLINEHERDYRAVRTEWVSLGGASLFTCGALAIMKAVLKGLIIHEERIRTNVARSAGLITTEALMFKLGEKIGKHRAHQLLYEASMAALEKGELLIDLLLAEPEIASLFSAPDLLKLMVPGNHIGLAGPLVDQVLARAGQRFSPTETNAEAELTCPLAREGGGCLPNGQGNNHGQ